MRALVIAAIIAWVACSFGEPGYDRTRFRCDDDHGCPAGQSCVDGLCDPGSAIGDGVGCGPAGVCAAGQTCCVDQAGPRCIAEGATCEGMAASCDGVEDCAGSEACCLDAVAACGADPCQRICLDATDCAEPQPECCLVGGLPWGRCSIQC